MTPIKVRKLLYVMMAGVLGSFGVHKFYTKRYKAGLVYLLLFWTFIPLILGVVEAMAVVMRPKDRNGCVYIDGDRFFDF